MARRVQTPEGNIMPGFHIISKKPNGLSTVTISGTIFSPINRARPYLLRPARGRIHFVLTLNWSIFAQTQI